MRLLMPLLVFVVASLPARAAITPEAFRELAYAGDVAGVEAAVAEAHRQSLDGDITFHDLRVLIATLNTTHPDMRDFVDDWVRAMPDSPYALTVRAMQLKTSAFDVRGVKPAAATHHDAHYDFHARYRDAQAIAAAAYASAPDFVPASDIHLGTEMASPTMSLEEMRETLRDVMEITPNHVSLAVAFERVRPAWGGGGLPELRALCDDFAPLSPIPDYTPDICIAEMIERFGLTAHGGQEFAFSVVERSDHPNLFAASLWFALNRRSADDRRFLADVLSRDDHDYLLLANNFAAVFDTTPEEKDMLAALVNRVQNRMRAKLIHDPYNPTHLTLFTAAHYPRLALYFQSTPQEDRNLRLRLAVARPFDPDAWRRAADAIGVSFRPGEADAQSPYFANAIHYSQHNPEMLMTYLWQLHEMYYEWQLIRADPSLYPGPVITDAEFGDLVICPALRTWRVAEAVCQLRDPSGEGKCMHLDGLAQQVQMWSEASMRNICASERNDPVETLLFHPVAIEPPPAGRLGGSD